MDSVNFDNSFDCLISNGAKHSITNVLAGLLNSGDEVVLLAPYWISYPYMINLFGGVPVVVKSNIYDQFTPSVSEIEDKITSKTKAIIINSPNNPTGVFYRDDWMNEFAEMNEKYEHVAIISDEIYYKLNYYDPNPTYFYQKKPDLLERTIIIDGISKVLSSTGLRIGYTIAQKDFIKDLTKLQGQTASGANSLIQKALLS